MLANALVLHGGGPTAVLNASLAGIVEAARGQPRIRSLYGAPHGADGLLQDSLIELTAFPPGIWQEISTTPGSVIGSSRKNLSEADFDQILAGLRRREIRYVFPTGGNGTMEMALRLDDICRASGYECRVIGVPKTIDNDIGGTDHTPGFASAARFFIHCLAYIGADNRALPGVTVVEILGRNAGWIAASTLLARRFEDDAPHLVYLPERRLPFDRLAADVERIYRKWGRAVVAVCEGQLDEKGEPFGADVRTSSRQPLALNLAHVLSQRISEQLKIKARSEKPGLLGRSCGALASPVDLAEARSCGAAAVRFAVAGKTGKMVTIDRIPGSAYQTCHGLVDLKAVAGAERLFPPEWMTGEADEPMAEFGSWLEPMVQPIARLGSLSDGGTL